MHVGQYMVYVFQLHLFTIPNVLFFQSYAVNTIPVTHPHILIMHNNYVYKYYVLFTIESTLNFFKQQNGKVLVTISPFYRILFLLPFLRGRGSILRSFILKCIHNVPLPMCLLSYPNRLLLTC